MDLAVVAWIEVGEVAARFLEPAFAAAGATPAAEWWRWIWRLGLGSTYGATRERGAAT